MTIRINAGQVKEAIEDFMQSMEEIGLDGVRTDLMGGEGSKYDDPRAAQLLGSWQNCRTMDSLNEISGYLNRLWPEILKLPRNKKRADAEKYFKRTVDNLQRCVTDTTKQGRR